MMTSSIGRRLLAGAVAACALTLCVSGCASTDDVFKIVLREVPNIRLPASTDDAVLKAARELETSASMAAREEASAKLAEAGLDFACLMQADEAVEPSYQALNDEIQARIQDSANVPGLEDIHAAYVYTASETARLSDPQLAAVGALFTLGTYCTLEGALQGF